MVSQIFIGLLNEKMFAIILLGIFCSAASGYQTHESFKGTFYPGGRYQISENNGPFQVHYNPNGARSNIDIQYPAGGSNSNNFPTGGANSNNYPTIVSEIHSVAKKYMHPEEIELHSRNLRLQLAKG
ncbi:UNVERIFIED_CONTAM: hypothetical protein NCL1_19524 [Trichonephila clavipes]